MKDTQIIALRCDTYVVVVTEPGTNPSSSAFDSRNSVITINSAQAGDIAEVSLE
jgi:hypothetical protein